MALGAVSGMVAESAVVDARSRLRCPAFAVDPEVRELATTHGHCPLGDTATDVTGYSHTPVGDRGVIWEDSYRIPGLGLVIIPHELALAWHADLAALEPPVDYVRPDGELRFLNFQGGHLVGGPITSTGVHLRRIVLGERYAPVSRVGDCPTADRPCVVSVERTADTVTVVWSFPDADAFNIQWWEERSPPTKGVEVAARRFTLRGADPARMYGFTIEACAKRFLGRSTCTPWSPTIVVPASL
ncbi:fibronectin type III domain-containing protein [Lentzea tibetensis]|uniref:Fibronectin type III domain-containing protein n=1 Tax=Lentzea tibetensis TaxID=2591470 RepID=A0A563EKF1_9PSEU|nr:fibronectin type III domain-containing protein [Lentzea tibetensis]TWP47014.1 fibronectin type III domain-containing protein [Lentzea tibetensis]